MDLFHIKELAKYSTYSVEILPDTGDFGYVCKFCEIHGNVVLAIDELDMFDNPWRGEHNFKRLIHYGRHLNVSIIGCTRRPANISRDFTSQTNRFYFLRTNEPTDLKYIRWIEPGIAEKVRDLPRFKYVSITDFGDLTEGETKREHTERPG